MNAPERIGAQDSLEVAGKAYRSRLLVGTGKYRDFDETRAGDRGLRRARS